MKNKTKASTRALRAAGRAEVWHQGSAIHADACFTLAEHFEALAAGRCWNEDDEETVYELRKRLPKAAALRVASLWADAAEAEADFLKECKGNWVGPSAWKRGISGKATAKATKASKKLISAFDLDDWC